MSHESIDIPTTIKSVTENGRFWDIETTDGKIFSLETKWGVQPRPGQSVRLQCVRGSEIRGVIIDGERVFYKTDEDLERERQEYLDSIRAEQEAELPAHVALAEALPGPWKSRVDMFRKRGGHEWDRRYLGYEVFACQEAAKIAAALPDAEAVVAFHGLTPDEQRERIPALSKDHSGNTFGVACTLARQYHRDARYLPFAHGALDALVGCEAYGCFASWPKSEQKKALKAAGIKPGEGE